MSETPAEATAADVAEQLVEPDGGVPPMPEPEVPLEAPAADALEQATEAATTERDLDRDLPLESDDLDAAEQSVVVAQDEDEYPV